MTIATTESVPLTLDRRLRYFAEAAVFFSAIGFFRLFNTDRASAIGGWIGTKLVAPTRFSVRARENLRAAYPEKSEREIEAVIRGMWENLGRVIAEYAHLDDFHWVGPAPRITVTGVEHIVEAKARAKGMLLISAHFANWEIMPIPAREYGLTGGTVVRPTNNPYVNRWLEKVRTRIGLPELIPKGMSGTGRILSLLRNRECINILVDQRLSEGIQAPFFGRDALTTPAPAVLARRFGAALVPISNERVDGAHFHIRVHPIIEPQSTGDPQRDVEAITTALNAFVEAEVRKRPQQWLWIHKRWMQDDVGSRKPPHASPPK